MISNKKGFSFVELMMILIFFFIILASLMPMITRRHLAPPQKVNHGTYACYYDGGVLKQTLVKGKKTIIDNQPAGAGGCHFEPPKKARYFYVQLIGGGGGGKDLTDAELARDEYKVKGSYIKEGGTVVQENSSSGGGDWTDLLTDAEFNTLVGGRKLVLEGTSEDGSVCSSAYASYYSYGCGDGVEDLEPYCKISKSSLPSGCSIPSDYTQSAGQIQHSCTPKADEPKVCDSCPSISCPAPTATDPTAKQDYPLTSATNMVSTKCQNDKNGKGTTCHKMVPLRNIGRNIVTHDSQWSNNASFCGYIRGGVPRQRDGYGHHFYIGSTNLLRICGGEGAQTGKNRFENPKALYYNQNPPKNEYCSLESEYLDAKNAECNEGSDGFAPALSEGEYLYPGVGIYDIKISQSQVIPYGVGGRAGELKTLILKTIPENLPIHPGAAGAVGVNGSDTTIGPGTDFPLKRAKGGQAGTSIFTSDVGISPYASDGETKQQAGNWRTFTTADMESRIGGKITYSTFVRFVISYNNKALKQRMEVFGQGGSGAATKTESTCGYLYEPVVLEDNGTELNKHMFAGHANFPVGTFASCNGHAWVTTKDADEDESTGYDLGYYAGALQLVATPSAGQSGAVVISW